MFAISYEAISPLAFHENVRWLCYTEGMVHPKVFRLGSS